MKFLASFLLLFVALMIAVDASPYRPPVQKPHPNAPKVPSFPGQGTWSGRPRRSPQKNGQVEINAKKEGGKTSWNVEGKQKVWGNEHGSIHISGGANKQPGGKPQGQIGIGGSFHWGK
ncbi:nabaecin-1 precursor [Nasonia vitripennis]|uniref:Nabaecin-1 n=1 Tax=Nasonia vitripennis TaxID=7425 RepID=D4P8I8_NASVI|nr:nabaecin-1 precursor [Nasonia vitripennis]ADD84771.1 nabaecin-1 precursor [Nasonia vitripennis]